jgi:hypothetical protein
MGGLKCQHQHKQPLAGCSGSSLLLTQHNRLSHPTVLLPFLLQVMPNLQADFPSVFCRQAGRCWRDRGEGSLFLRLVYSSC